MQGRGLEREGQLLTPSTCVWTQEWAWACEMLVQNLYLLVNWFKVCWKSFSFHLGYLLFLCHFFPLLSNVSSMSFSITSSGNPVLHWRLIHYQSHITCQAYCNCLLKRCGIAGNGGLYTGTPIPTDSGGLRRTPMDSNGLRRSPMHCNGFRWS
jgi:hypothetical protein